MSTSNLKNSSLAVSFCLVCSASVEKAVREERLVTLQKQFELINKRTHAMAMHNAKEGVAELEEKLTKLGRPDGGEARNDHLHAITTRYCSSTM